MNTNWHLEEESDCLPREDRCSSTSTSTSPEEDLPLSEQAWEQELLPELKELRFGLFENEGESGEISQRMSQRAVCWLMTVSWSKGVDDECLWLALLLFSLFKLQGRVHKDSLEPLLLTCLMIASKISSSQPLSAREVATLTRRSTHAVAKLQCELLESVDFDVIIPHYLSELANCPLSPSVICKVEFLCQLLMVRSCRVFFDRQLLTAIVRLVEGEDQPEGDEIRKDIREMLAFKDCQIVVKKFQSKMDVEGFLKSFM